MRLVTFYTENETRLGAIQGDSIVDLAAVDPTLPSDMVAFLRGGEVAMTRARHALASGEGPAYPLATTRLAAPIPRPSKVIGIGLNYSDHAAESGLPLPKRPVVFAKFPSSVIGPGETITWSTEVTEQVDYEAELAVIIGRIAKNVALADAMRYIAGYACANDVSARDVQSGARSDAGQWVRGKSLDTFCPLGPMLVTRDEVPDPGQLWIRCELNGQYMQNSSTSKLIFDVPTLVSFLSHSFTLEPGDVILTGTPPGVGSARKPPVWLKPGDVVAIEVEGLGRLENPVSAG